MRYYKQIPENYIIAIGTGSGGEEITKKEYDSIMEVIRNCLHAEGKGYRLCTDLTWEEYDLPVPPPPDSEEEATEDEIGRALEEIL